MIPISVEFVVSSMFVAYISGWVSGYLILSIKQFAEKI